MGMHVNGLNGQLPVHQTNAKQEKPSFFNRLAKLVAGSDEQPRSPLPKARQFTQTENEQIDKIREKLLSICSPINNDPAGAFQKLAVETKQPELLAAAINKRSGRGVTCFTLAATNGNRDLVTLFAANGANLNAAAASPFSGAIENRNIDMVAHLLDLGAIPTHINLEHALCKIRPAGNTAAVKIEDLEPKRVQIFLCLLAGSKQPASKDLRNLAKDRGIEFLLPPEPKPDGSIVVPLDSPTQGVLIAGKNDDHEL